MKPRILLLLAASVLLAADLEKPSLIAESKIEPTYTLEAQSAQIMGTVVLEINIDDQGSPSLVRVKKSLGYGLDESATKAVERWRFRPAKKDGKPVPSVATVEINFRLKVSPPPADV